MRGAPYAVLIAMAFAATAQAAPIPAAPLQQGHVVVVKMIDASPGQYAFDPTTITAEQGDTVRFIDSSSVPHNVAFRAHPKGAKIDAITEGPLLTSPGQTYDIVIDKRFVAGTYHIVCSPHEALGMTVTLTVK